MNRALLVRCAAAGLVSAAAVVALAHGTSVLDLETIEARVDARVDVTVGRERGAYLRLRRALRRESRRGLRDDLAKVRAVARACEGPVADDDVLRAALAEVLVETDAVLDGDPDDLAAAVRRLERPVDREQVDALVAAARDAHLQARALGAGEDAARARGFLRAAQVYARAEALARRLLDRQVRRGAPGQPLRRGPSGTIDTYAGTGARGFTADGRPALDSPLYWPQDAASDPSTGELHIADWNNHLVRRIGADGRLWTVAGSGALGDTEGPALAAKLHHPTGLAFHPVTGDLLIAGWHVHKVIRLVRATGTIEHLAGTDAGDAGDGGPVAAALFDYPSSVAFDSAGNWYVADQQNHRVRSVGTNGTITAFAGTGEPGFAGDGADAVAARLANPDAEAVGPAGRVCLDRTERFLYIADSANHRVRRVEIATGTITTVAGNGVAASTGDGGPAIQASLSDPCDVDCDAAGNVYVCERGSHVVRRVRVADGVIETVAGAGNPGYTGDGGPAGFARLDHPSGIFVDRARGRLYVADTLNSVIRVVWE